MRLFGIHFYSTLEVKRALQRRQSPEETYLTNIAAMSTLMLLLSLFLVVSPSLGVELCKCKKNKEDDEPEPLPTTKAPSQDKEEYKVTFTEKGQKVEERIKIDKKKQTETFHVPSHSDIDGADIIHDFKQNLTMYRLPERKRCYLSPLDPSLSSPRKLSRDLQQKPTDGITTSETKWKASGEVKDRTTLSDEMAKLCAKFPIYRITPAQSSMSVSKVRTKRGCWVCGRTCYYVTRCSLHCDWSSCHTHCKNVHVTVSLICCF